VTGAQMAHLDTGEYDNGHIFGRLAIADRT
jgi:hypothetical protein